MCITHTVSYPHCPHIHSYTELVHDNAPYCKNQQVIHDGTSTTKDKCTDCTVRDKLKQWREEHMGKGKDKGQMKGNETEELEFNAEYFGRRGEGDVQQRRQDEASTTTTTAAAAGHHGGMLRDDGEEKEDDWHILQEEELQGHDEYAGIGEDAFEMENMSRGQILPASEK